MDKYRIRLKEKNGLILDIGVAYTKIGFTGDNGPIKIVHTPRDIFREFKDEIPKVNESDPFMADSLSKQGLDMKIQTFLHEVFFFELIQKLPGKIIYICENYLIPRKFYESLTSVLLTQFEISKVQFLLNNSLPLYLTGQLSGLVVECGYYNTQITPIYDGYPLFNKLASSKASGYNMNKYLKNQIKEDNSNLNINVSTDSTILQSSASNMSSSVISESIINNQNPEIPIDFVALEDIKFKYCKILLKNQQEEYNKTEGNAKKLKESVISVPLNMSGSLKPSKIKLSYQTITSSCSDGLFGDIMNNDQPNIAFSILSCLGQCAPEVAVKISQNIVLSGGAVSTRGFLPRLRQELIYQLDNNPEVKSAAYLKEHISFFDHNYPPSTLVWVGASIVSQLSLSDENSMTLEQFKQLKYQLPDTFGNQYLFLNNTNPTEIDNNLESEEIL